MKKFYLAVDPGRDKCGLAVVGEDKEALFLRTVKLSELTDTLLFIAGEYGFLTVLLGDGTGARNVRLLLLTVWPEDKIIMADERATTLWGRRLYWRRNPPAGLRKYLPHALLTPAEPLDAYAAWAIALRWLDSN